MTKDCRNYFRLKSENKNVELQVCKISWNGPHMPITKWETVKVFETIELSELDKEIISILNDPSYFIKCEKCHEYNLLGHMFREKMCQKCASFYLDIVY